MHYDEVIEQIIEQLLLRDDVKKFQKSEAALREETVLFEMQAQMVKLQKEAILYREIGKGQAYKETSQAAQKIQKSLKNNPLVEDYLFKMKDVNTLVQYVTGEIEQKVNERINEPSSKRLEE